MEKQSSRLARTMIALVTVLFIVAFAGLMNWILSVRETRLGTTPPPQSPTAFSQPAPTPTVQTRPEIQTETVPPPLSPPRLASVKMFDEQNGWGLATNFTSGFLLHTQDGGRTWQRVNPAEALYFNASQMLDAQNGWLFLDKEDNRLPGNLLLRTQDMGNFWQPFEVPFANLTQIQFRSADLGWAVESLCDNGPAVCGFNFYQTHDGGQTWTSLHLTDPLDPASPSPFSRGWQLWFRDAQMAWAGGKTIQPESNIPLDVTRDGGQSWQETPISIVNKRIAFEDGITYSDPILLSDSVIYQAAYYRVSDNGVSSYPVWVLLATLDGGETWALAPTPESWNGAIDFVNTLDAFAICGSELCATHDGAQTWTPIASSLDFTDTDSHHVKIDFVSPMTGWAVEFKPDNEMRWILHYTTDGGLTWEEIFPVIK